MWCVHINVQEKINVLLIQMKAEDDYETWIQVAKVWMCDWSSLYHEVHCTAQSTSLCNTLFCTHAVLCAADMIADSAVMCVCVWRNASWNMHLSPCYKHTAVGVAENNMHSSCDLGKYILTLVTKRTPQQSNTICIVCSQLNTT